MGRFQQPLAPMGTCIGANGLDSAAETGVPAFCPGIVTFTAGLCTCSDIHVYGIKRYAPPKFSLTNT